ncbi:hypothetical protein ACTXT7_014058 [Hymenolepis weldensis]
MFMLLECTEMQHPNTLIENTRGYLDFSLLHIFLPNFTAKQSDLNSRFQHQRCPDAPINAGPEKSTCRLFLGDNYSPTQMPKVIGCTLSVANTLI